MRKIQRAAIVTRLARKMREEGSWCGETHLQKALYLAQELLGVPTEFDFILYKHGPFSFDFRDELSSLRADMLLRIEPQPRPFGPRFAPTSQSERIEALFPKTLKKLDLKLGFIADKLSDKGVAELERLATAQYVKNQGKKFPTIGLQAERIHELKPHVSVEDAQDAIVQITEFANQAQAISS